MKTHTDYLWFNTKTRQEFVRITDDIAIIVGKSGVKEGMALVSAMHITAAVYVNDWEDGLVHDFQEWLEKLAGYRRRGVIDGPMHYPTHSTSGPICVMKAHMTKVCAVGQRDRTGDEFFAGSLTNETALFEMSNGAAVRISEYRRIGHTGQETFRVFGTAGCYKDGSWITKDGSTPLAVEQMRDPLPREVVEAWSRTGRSSDFYGGHGGSHAYLVHEFVDAVARDRVPAINVWEAVRYMAAGAAAHKSALRDGEVVEVPDWGDAPS